MTIEELKKLDSTFSESMFLTKVDHIFIQLFTSIMLNELETVKHFITDDIYNRYKVMVDSFAEHNKRQMYDELNVKSSKIISIDEKDNKYFINVYLEARYMDYILDLNSGEKISGYDDHRIQVDYILEFVRNINVLSQGMVRKCPGCGANIDVNSSGKCEYCGAIYNQSDYDWVLNSIKVV